jgi:hypothetical protein
MSLNAIKAENLKPKKTDYRAADGGNLYLLVLPNLRACHERQVTSIKAMV